MGLLVLIDLLKNSGSGSQMYRQRPQQWHLCMTPLDVTVLLQDVPLFGPQGPGKNEDPAGIGGLQAAFIL